MEPRRIHRAALAILLAASFLSPVRAEPETSVFGSRQASQTALIGNLYDLKQTQEHKPVPMNIKTYGSVVDEFLSKDWDESVLNKYFRATRPLYTTQIFIPLISADSAPRAFGVEKIVQPSFWLIHYKGQVAAPSDGYWRFWGDGEEVCSVAVNGRNVLLANWREITTPNVPWKSPEPPGMRVANSQMRAGDWMQCKAGQVMDLDVLIGERAGGVFCAFLLIEKRGENYQRVEGSPVLPVFQLAPFNTPVPRSTRLGPPIQPDGPIWKATH
ncbi:MAG: hypothetical protein WCQ57_13615 [Verrucomicrobiota bacterium]